jgi:SOS response regulatory protein OraA/RecX
VCALILARAGYSRDQVADLLADIDPAEVSRLTTELLDEAARQLARHGFTYPGIQTAVSSLRTGLPPSRAPATSEDDQLALFT